MARFMGYFEDNSELTYEEGPFVVVNAITGWRIECQSPGSDCPCLPDLSIYEWRKKYGHFKEGNYRFTASQKQAVTEAVDALNLAVKSGEIIQNEHGSWYWPGEKHS